MEMIGRPVDEDRYPLELAGDAADIGAEGSADRALIDGSWCLVPKITWKRRLVNVWAMVTLVLSPLRG
jgi:hypothetical protein